MKRAVDHGSRSGQREHRCRPTGDPCDRDAGKGEQSTHAELPGASEGAVERKLLRTMGVGEQVARREFNRERERRDRDRRHHDSGDVG